MKILAKKWTIPNLEGGGEGNGSSWLSSIRFLCPSSFIPRPSSGFTLIELMVVILIVGILAAIGYPQYVRTMEVSKANDAVALVTMAGNANRMYALDHASSSLGSCIAQSGYTSGSLSGCAASSCIGDCSSACDVINCGYLASDNYAAKSYQASLGLFSSGVIATVQRTVCPPPIAGGDCTNTSPYSSWGYQMAAGTAVVSPVGSGTPPPAQ